MLYETISTALVCIECSYIYGIPQTDEPLQWLNIRNILLKFVMYERKILLSSIHQ